MIVDVAVFGPGANLPAARSITADRIAVTHDPGGNVEIVDVLLHVEIAGEPGEVVPIPHLPRHVGPTLFARPNPDAAAKVVGDDGDWIADGPVVDAANRVAIGVGI